MTEGFDHTHSYMSYADIPVIEFTEGHIELFQTRSEDWRKHAFSTAPVNKSNALSAINELYKIKGLNPPHIVWTKSPLANIFAKLLRDRLLKSSSSRLRTDQVHFTEKVEFGDMGPTLKFTPVETLIALKNANVKSIRTLMDDSGAWFDFFKDVWAIRSSLLNIREFINFRTGFVKFKDDGGSLTLNRWTKIFEGVEFGLSGERDESYTARLSDKLLGSLRGSKDDKTNIFYAKGDQHRATFLRRKLRTLKFADVYDTSIGYITQFDLADHAEYLFLHDAGFLPRANTINELYKLCASTGSVLPLPDVCYVSDRPVILNIDDSGLPHCEDAPAIQYADGFSLHAWHGVKFPQEWAATLPSPADALKWPNIEQRRVACEMLGWDRILDVLNAVVINKDNDPEIGELVSVNIPDIGDEKFLRVRCGTGRNFALPVPPDMKTALEANAWTWGLEPNEYRPEIRT